MGKVKGKHRLDKFYYLAKEHGYRSRAAWKLVQLDTKFNFLRSARSVLDLCAAPGGWMQVAVERAPVGSLVVGVDLDPIRPIRGAFSLQEDITGPKCRSGVKRLMAENGCGAFELILHDGSPNVGGAWTKEATSQNALVIDSVKLATELLAPKGTFITKVFRSQDYTAVLYCLRQLFEKVEVDKPLASRSASAEIYIIGLKYKAPAKIDPRLLDVKHLFQAGQEPPKVVDVLRTSKQKRHRDGYEDGESISKKTCSASEFLWSDSPLDILGSVTSISFGDSASLAVKDHTLTTEEVKALCDDLRVLGKQDFKHLLKWRTQLRKALAPSEKAAPAPKSIEPEKEVDEEEKLLDEMEELTNAMERKKKRAKKLLVKKRAKDKARKALGNQMDAVEDGYGDQDLFSLTSMKGKKDLAAVDNNEYDDADLGNSESDENHDGSEGASDIDSEEERRRYDEKVERLLDDAYEHMVSKREGRSSQRKRSKESYSKNDDLAEDDGDAIANYDDSDDELPNQESNPLMVELADTEPTQEEIAAQWFNQDVFMDEDERVELDQDESDDEMQVDPPLKHLRAAEKVKEKGPEKPVGKQNSKMQPSKSAKLDDEIEIVPAPDTDSSDSSDDESDEDDINTKAEILACAKKMLTKKQREDMIDDAYNKYMFHDDGLPKWFVDEEKKHYQPIKPVTKEEVAAMRAHFKAIDARPAKKVAQAKARKKRDAHRQLEKIRKKANAVSDQADISERSKNKMIDQLYRKAAPKRTEKEYVVAKKGVQVKTGKGKVLVDRRMKKDARTRGMNKQGKGKGGGKQKGKGGMRSSGKGKGREGRKAK